jgi:hypothetical protein
MVYKNQKDAQTSYPSKGPHISFHTKLERFRRHSIYRLSTAGDKFTLSASVQCITYIKLKRKTIISKRIPLLSQMKSIINYVFFFKNQEKTVSFPHNNRTSEISERFQFLILHSENWSHTYRIELKYKSTHASRRKIRFWCSCSKLKNAAS